MDGKQWSLSRIFFEASGWYGLIALLLAYAVVSAEIVPASSLAYQLLNLTGSLTMVILTLYKKAYQNAILNIIWAGISIIALAHIFLAI